MSILDFPRLNFRGIFVTDPCTTNNDDVVPSVVTRDTNDLSVDLKGLSDDEVTEYLNAPVEMSNFEAYPQQDKRTFVRAGWNPMGDFTTSFQDTVITSAVTGPGANQAGDAAVGIGFEIIGAPKLNGTGPGSAMICDLDPTGLVSTQLFVGGVRFFKMEGGQKTTLVEILHDTRGFQDWLNFCTTVQGTPYGGEQNFVGIGCVWQFVIPAAKLPAADGLGVASPVLKALFTQAQAAGGLAVRFKTYEVEPGYTDTYLAAQLGRGNMLHNPAYGYLVGTIGVWGADEPQSEPAGRKLQPHYRTASPSQPLDGKDPGRPDLTWWDCKDDATRKHTVEGTVKGGPYPWMCPPALIGNAVALVRQDPPVVSLDILEAFPKYKFRNPNGPQTNNPPEGFGQPKQKAYVGDVELAVIPAGGGAAISIGPVDYGYPDFSTYENFGGIVDITYDPAKVSYQTIAGGQLILRATAGPNQGKVLIEETVIRVVTDDRTAYITPADKDYPIRVKVYERGGPTTRPVTLFVNEYKTIVQLAETAPAKADPDRESCERRRQENDYRTNQSVDSRTAPLTAPGQFRQCPPAPAKPQPPTLLAQKSVTIPAGTTGWVTIPVTPNVKDYPGGATAVLAIQQDYGDLFGTIPPAKAGAAPLLNVAGVPMWSTMTYCSVRMFENTDFSDLYKKPGGLQWADVYKYALRYYNLIFPAMSAYIALGSSSSISDAYNAGSIRQRLGRPGEPVFLTTLNMPATRTLSPARVKLILDFIDQQGAKG
ncbi:MAG: hypothetical protein ACM31L_17100 [Actinomycetota bacterium]